MTALSAHSFAMRVHIYPDIGVGLATGSPFKMKVETRRESNRAKIALRNAFTAECAGVLVTSFNANGAPAATAKTEMPRSGL
jgi:hypothetical protein